MRTFTIFFTFFLLSCLFTEAGNGQTMNIKGKVIDKNTLEPLSGVNISLENNELGIGTITNHKGEFRLWNLPHNSSKILVSLNGYETSSVEVSTLQNPTTGTITVIKLDEKSRANKNNLNDGKVAFLKKRSAANK